MKERCEGCGEVGGECGKVWRDVSGECGGEVLGECRKRCRVSVEGVGKSVEECVGSPHAHISPHRTHFPPL